jgi:hypothetical protein
MAGNNVQAAQAFYDAADDDARDHLATALYYRELETIARPKPLLDEGPSPNAYPVKTVELYDRDQQAASQGVSLRGGESPWRTSPRRVRRKSTGYSLVAARILAKFAQAIQLDDSDDDDAAAAPPPGPLTDMSMDIPALRVKLGYTKPFEQQFSREATFAKSLLATGYGHTTQEGMFTTTADWKGYLGNYRGREVLFKGFPMVGDVVFIKHPNYWTNLKDHGKLVESGQCYWLAMALILYGSADYWLRVKAEHLSFLETVLMNSQHPRHAFYTRENQTSGETQASGPGNQAGFTANLWERLQIPGCWNNEDMCQLTSEVYGVFVVLYKYDGSSNKEWRNKVYDMKTYGAYNRQHIFLCYSVSSVFDCDFTSRLILTSYSTRTTSSP